jgi:Restriction endonuclease
MSGPEFERYMASVFEALGYKATVLGGAGDQGVDLLLQKENELIAVQCNSAGPRNGNLRVSAFGGAQKAPVPHTPDAFRGKAPPRRYRCRKLPSGPYAEGPHLFAA